MLRAVIQCPEKEKYVNAILTLNDSCQDTLMLIIEKLISKCNRRSRAEDTSRSSASAFDRLRDSPARLGGFTARAQSLEKNLLMKLKELENENQTLYQKLANITQEKDDFKAKTDEMNLETDKKNEEVNTS